MELVRSDGVPDRKDIISSVEGLRATTDAMSVFFSRVLSVAASEVIDSALVSISVLGLDFVNFSVFLIDFFLVFALAWPDA